MTVAEVSAVVVTKGDRDITPIVESLSAFSEVIIYDNSQRTDYKVYGRFVAAALARNDVVFTQDDDTIVDAAAVVAAYEPGVVVANLPECRRAEYVGTGISLLGWGAVFQKWAMDVFGQYLAAYPKDELFLRECDRIFTYLNRDRVRMVDVEYRQMAYAFGNDRMGREPRHRADFLEARRRLAGLGKVAA